MKKLIILSIILLASTICYAIDPAEKLGIPSDKVLHFEASYLLCDFMQDGLQMTPADVFLSLGAISLTKEYIDSKTGGRWDNSDIMANYCGWLVRRIFVVKLNF